MQGVAREPKLDTILCEECGGSFEYLWGQGPRRRFCSSCADLRGKRRRNEAKKERYRRDPAFRRRQLKKIQDWHDRNGRSGPLRRSSVLGAISYGDLELEAVPDTVPRLVRTFDLTSQQVRSERPVLVGCRDCGVAFVEPVFRSDGRLQPNRRVLCRVCARRGKSPGEWLTTAERDELAARQGEGCAICGEECVTGRNLAVDHCHETGEIRGLLCFACNAGLGHYRDDPALLRAAASYLERSRLTLVA